MPWCSWGVLDMYRHGADESTLQRLSTMLVESNGGARERGHGGGSPAVQKPEHTKNSYSARGHSLEFDHTWAWSQLGNSNSNSGGPGRRSLEERGSSRVATRRPIQSKTRNAAAAARECCHSFLTATGLLDIKRLLPICNWLPQYSRSKMLGDLIAGLTVGLMVLPQGLAYASIAGLPNYYGLYSSFIGVIVYCFTGSSKDITLGWCGVVTL